MRPKDVLDRARRMAASRGALTGEVTLCYPDADPDGFCRTVDMKDYPPGPGRDALLDGAVVMTGTHEEWALRMIREDEEAEPCARETC